MKIVATNAAKTHLSSLLQDVQRGETIIIARGRKPLAKLIPYEEILKPRPKVGETLDAPLYIPEEALRPSSGEELREWGI